MSRLAIASALLLTACAWNPFDPNGLRNFPRTTRIDERLHLSPQDRDQIFRLVYGQSSQQISSVLPGTRQNTVEVFCGYDDIVNDVPRLTGDGFTLEKTGSTWRILSKGQWMR